MAPSNEPAYGDGHVAAAGEGVCEETNAVPLAELLRGIAEVGPRELPSPEEVAGRGDLLNEVQDQHGQDAENKEYQNEGDT